MILNISEGCIRNTNWLLRNVATESKDSIINTLKHRNIKIRFENNHMLLSYDNKTVELSKPTDYEDYKSIRRFQRNKPTRRDLLLILKLIEAGGL